MSRLVWLGLRVSLYVWMLSGLWRGPEPPDYN